ncbi:uncharacterized protein ASPGLDRAFT_125406 [Aspergillus glaucus CBS 516.65]|uniref:Uncharacterized protein n=1 Tax=Aspergillus glaucus CBS 516.65 TaxID=1160497 RepID=A0A1L9VLN6_ASPGL|nr:hypothetical protein ASPGLDRAFT_125406 [Aspergillus glaucus CBS 516.65]OJJ84805.1 hypothetical protein ASPGLDRAFT_125406 [Aspergillus glaucus CBS 516.65]
MGLKAWDKHQHTLADLCRSFFGFEKSGGDTARAKVKDTDATARVKSEGSKSNARARDTPKANDNVAPVFEASQSQGSVDTRANDLEFDPISGRMVPKPAAAATTGEAGALSKDGTSTVPDTSNVEDGHLGSLSPTKSSSEATAVTSDPDIGGVQHKEPEQRANEIAQDHGIPECAENSNLVDSQQPKSLTPDAQPNEGRKMKGFFYLDKKEPEKLKIQDSPQQSEPFLVPENEELDLLRASDIRASYPSKGLDMKSDVQSKKVDGALEEITPDENSVTESNPESQDSLGSVDERSTEAPNYTGTQSSLQEAEAPQSTQPQVQDGLPDFTKVLDQTSETHSPILSESASPATYRVLAYDPFTMQVTTADTDSSLAPSHKILHPSDVLPRLSNPAQFLPYFEEMRKEGYEIVSGGGDILVFKRFFYVDKRPSDKSSLETKEHEDTTADGVLKELQDQAALKSPQLTESSSAKTSKTEPETEIPPRKQRSAFNNAIRRMLFTGIAAAGTCYAFGVVVEYFRTGGSDGRGVDAFTVFESDRRQMD